MNAPTIPGVQVYDLAMYAYFAAYVAYAVHVLLYRARWAGMLATSLLCAGFALHTAFLVQRSQFYYEQHGGFLLPATNMYEAISYFAWLVVLVYLISERVLRSRAFALFALVVPVVALAYGSRAMEQDPRDLFPSLKSYWLPFHITAMFISYSLFFMAFVFGLMYVLRAWGVKAISWLDSRYDLAYLDTLSSRFIRIGVPVISLGIGLGAVWANASWGKAWGWDPKETWALITWFVYIVYLHFRSYSWFTPYRAALGSMLGFVVVLITFQGVNLIDTMRKTNSIHAYAVGGNPALILSILGVMLVAPLVLLFMAPPAAAEAHKRSVEESLLDQRKDSLPPPQRLGGPSHEGKPLAGSEAPQNWPADDGRDR